MDAAASARPPQRRRIRRVRAFLRARPGGQFRGRHWHLHVARGLEEIAKAVGRPAQECGALLVSARARLFEAREQRIRPGRDEKILTSWNALMIAGMARAARVFGRPEWLASARAALDFIRATLWREKQGRERARLLATCKDGRAHLNAYLDDYAYLLAALIELMQTDFLRRDLEFAEDLAEALLEQFYDPGPGGFYFTSHDHEKLIHRPKPGYDSATPPATAWQPWRCSGWAYHRRIALPRCRPAHAAAVLSGAGAASRWLRQPADGAGGGDRSAAAGGAARPEEQMRVWRRALDQAYLPTTLILALAPGAEDLPLPLAKPLAPAAVNAWVCQGVTCLAPVDTLEKLLGVLKTDNFR